MMRRLGLAISAIFYILLLLSCSRNVPLEDLTITLILGIDLDDENNLVISQSSPVFNKDAKKNIETYQIKANSIRESRKYFDALATGEVTAEKIQVILVGKRILEHEDWFAIMDTVYRNPNFSINSRVFMVDGQVSDIIFYEPEDKPHLPLHLKEVYDKNFERSRTVTSTLQGLHREMFDKGITPTVTQIKKEKDVVVTGVSLLNQKGKYVDTLDIQDTSLMLVLQDKKQQELTLSFPISKINIDDSSLHSNEISIDVEQLKTKVKTNYDKGAFHFDYQIDMSVNLVERLFPENLMGRDQLEKMIEEELKNRIEALIQKVQEKKIDPIGLGIYARAFEYEQYQKVKENWGEALSEANIHISLNVDIDSIGAVK